MHTRRWIDPLLLLHLPSVHVRDRVARLVSDGECVWGGSAREVCAGCAGVCLAGLGEVDTPSLFQQLVVRLKLGHHRQLLLGERHATRLLRLNVGLHLLAEGRDSVAHE